MKISINGLVFNIEADAYDLLSEYLVEIKGYLGNSSNADDILNDIEVHFSEKLLLENNSRDDYFVVKRNNIKSIIEIMGSPKQIVFGYDEYSDNNVKGENKSVLTFKNLKRDKSYNILGGVCSGLGDFFGISGVIIRLLFVALFVFAFFWGFALKILIVYIILWIVMPVKINNIQNPNYFDVNINNEKNGRLETRGTKQILIFLISLILIIGGLGFIIWYSGNSYNITTHTFYEFNSIYDYEHQSMLEHAYSSLKDAGFVRLLFWFAFGIPIAMIIYFIISSLNKRIFERTHYFLFSAIIIVWLISVFALAVTWKNLMNTDNQNPQKEIQNQWRQKNNQNGVGLDNEDDAEFMENDIF